MDSIKKFFNKIKIDKMLTSVLTVVIGILMIIYPNDALKVVCIACGVGLIVCAVVELIGFLYNVYKFSFVKVVGLIAIACWLFTIPGSLIGALINIVVGLVLIAQGGSEIQNAIWLGKNKIDGWIFLLVAGILTTGFGIAMFFIPGLTMIFLGITLAVEGIVSIVSIAIFTVQSRKIKKDIRDMIEANEVFEDPQK